MEFTDDKETTRVAISPSELQELMIKYLKSITNILWEDELYLIIVLPVVDVLLSSYLDYLKEYPDQLAQVQAVIKNIHALAPTISILNTCIDLKNLLDAK